MGKRENACPGSRQELGRGCRNGSCCSSRTCAHGSGERCWQKATELVFTATHPSLLFISLFFISLYQTVLAGDSSDVNATPSCFIFLSCFVTARDQRHPASWPRVRAAITLNFEAFSCERQTESPDPAGLYFSSDATLWRKRWVFAFWSSDSIWESKLNIHRWAG